MDRSKGSFEIYNAQFSSARLYLSGSESVTNNFRGGGPEGGLNGKWILGNVNRHVFSLFGNFAGAFMWGHWTLKDKFIDILGSKTLYRWEIEISEL